MSNSSNQEFLNMLSTVLGKQAFELKTFGETLIKFKPLSTAQYKNLIKTIVDSTLTQVEFNDAVLTVMKECAIETSASEIENLTILDKLLFLVDTRIHSISSSITLQNGEETVTLNLLELKEQLHKLIKENESLLKDHEIKTDDFLLTVGLPTLKAEQQINNEVYRTATLDANDPEQVRKLLGEAFVIELTKSIKSITIQDKSLNLSELSFKERQKIVESLPASAIQAVINYVESYKKIINKSVILNETTLPIDGSLFSLQ